MLILTSWLMLLFVYKQYYCNRSLYIIKYIALFCNGTSLEKNTFELKVNNIGLMGKTELPSSRFDPSFFGDAWWDSIGYHVCWLEPAIYAGSNPRVARNVFFNGVPWQNNGINIINYAIQNSWCRKMTRNGWWNDRLEPVLFEGAKKNVFWKSCRLRRCCSRRLVLNKSRRLTALSTIISIIDINVSYWFITEFYSTQKFFQC